MARYLMALDQGTTSSRAVLYDRQCRPAAMVQREIRQIYPRPGWVEHDPWEIWETQLAVAREAISQAGAAGSEIAAIGITNQRETTLLWDRATGQPLANAIVWQCRRTAERCELLRQGGHEGLVHERTGLLLDPYFAATKLEWLLDELPGSRARAERGEICFGTVDTWLIYQLSGGKVHATDPSNASRTLLYNISTLEWDQDLLRLFGVPPTVLPVVVDSSGVCGQTVPELFGHAIPLAGIAGDQQAALFGQGCSLRGMAKNTYGTGSFLLMNTGEAAPKECEGLLRTVAWRMDGVTTYALEGSVFASGAAVQWLRDGLHIISHAADSEEVARTVPDAGGVYMVPAFAGLGAPYWDPYARGALLGLTRGTTRAHVVRAALEAIAYQTRDVMELMERCAGVKIAELRVDGGAVGNQFLMQFQADMLGVPVQVPQIREVTSLGAALLAGLAVGWWDGLEDVGRLWREARRYVPMMPPSERERLYGGWRHAVARCRGWLSGLGEPPPLPVGPGRSGMGEP